MVTARSWVWRVGYYTTTQEWPYLFNFVQQQSDTHDLLVHADSLLEQTLHTGRLYREVDSLLPCFREEYKSKSLNH
jgi:hypothetical protein